MRRGATFSHRGVPWQIERIVGAAIYCRPLAQGRQSWRKFILADGTLEWGRAAVAARLKENATKRAA